MLSHEDLDVYDCAIEYFSVAAKAVERVPRGYGELRDQLRRASISIPLNIAEGAGKKSVSDSSRYYAMARGSAQECGAIFDALQVLEAIEPEEHRKGKRLLVRLVSMLTKMCDAHKSNDEA